MPVDTLNRNKDAYVHYEFVYVKCSVCGEKSNDFVHKDHLEADDMIKYIEEITGFLTRDTSEAPVHSYFNNGVNYSEGGLACQTCQGAKNIVEEVANG